MNASRADSSCLTSSVPSANDISVVAFAIRPSSFLEQALNSGTAARWSVTLVFGMDGAYGNASVRAGRSAASGDVGETRAKRAVRSRSEEHTSEPQSLMRISYAVFC